MLNWDQLNKVFGPANERHRNLRRKFDEFAQHAAECVAQPSFHIKGVEVDLHLLEGFFWAKFATKTIRFQFETGFGENKVLVALVSVHLISNFEKPEHKQLGLFKFNGGGETDFLDDAGDRILIDSDIGALYIVMNYVYKGLCAHTDIDMIDN